MIIPDPAVPNTDFCTKIKDVPSWRDVLPIHPAANLFPLMSPDELRALGDDIVKNGLTSPIVLWCAHPKGQAQLLDGRNRLDAIELATGSPAEVGAPSITAGKGFLALNKVVVLDKSVDPYAYVISANIRRRHLSIEDKGRLIVKVLQADPTKSNRTVAKLTDTSHPHVAKVREQAEKAGDVETVTTSIDTKGRQQPAKRPRNLERAKIHRGMKLGAETMARIRGTPLDNARELDALVILNRGAAPGELTNDARQLVEDAAAGKAVSAIAYTAKIQGRNEPASPVSEKALQQRAAAAERFHTLRGNTEPDSAGKTAPTTHIEELEAQLKHFKAQSIELRSENRELKAALANKLAAFSNEKLLTELERRLSPQFLKTHQAALKAIRRALDSVGQNVGPVLDLEAIPVADSEATKH
jgi:hypothetical protein